MRGPQRPHNVVLSPPNARAMRAEFLAWQCQIRQAAVREQHGRPSVGMRPRVLTEQGELLDSGIVTLLAESAPDLLRTTRQFQFEYLKTYDPRERYTQVLRILQASHFQEPVRFSGILTALFAGAAVLPDRLLRAGSCVLEFQQSERGYRLPCDIARAPPTHLLYQMSLWHNRLFNPYLPPDIDVLLFTPDWRHSFQVNH